MILIKRTFYFQNLDLSRRMNVFIPAFEFFALAINWIFKATYLCWRFVNLERDFMFFIWVRLENFLLCFVFRQNWKIAIFHSNRKEGRIKIDWLTSMSPALSMKIAFRVAHWMNCNTEWKMHTEKVWIFQFPGMNRKNENFWFGWVEIFPIWIGSWNWKKKVFWNFSWVAR